MVGQVRSTLDSQFHKQDIFQNCLLDDLNCFNFRKFLVKYLSLHTEDSMNDAKFIFTTDKLSNNPKIENTITQYVKTHMLDYLKENNYKIFLSGGIDSENIANIFLQCNIRFTPIIVSYVHKDKVLNDYDIAYAYKFCKENNLTPQVIDIDIVDFFSTGKFRKYAFEYKCDSPQFAPILHAFEKVDGNILYSGHQKIFTNLVYQSRLSNKNFIDIVDNYSLNGDVKNDVNFMEKSSKFFVFDNFLKNRNDNSISDFYNFNTDMSLTATKNFVDNTDISYDELLKYNSWEFIDERPIWAMDFRKSEFLGVRKRELQFRNLKKKKYNFKVDNLYTPNKLFAKARTKYTGFEGLKKFYSDKYIGKDLLLEQFDKYFRETMRHANINLIRDPGIIVNYLLREE